MKLIEPERGQGTTETSGGDPRHSKTVDSQVEFILNHPAMSQWLKDALASAVDRDTSEVLNDLEFLNHLFRVKAAMVDETCYGRLDLDG